MRHSILLLAFAACAFAPTALAQRALFAPATEAQQTLSGAQAVKAGALATRATTASLDVVRVNAEAFSAGGDLFAALPGAASVVLSPESVELNRSGSLSWVGTGEGDISGHFVIRDGNVTASIRTKDGLFRVRPLGDGLHALIRVDERAFPKDHEAADEEFVEQVFRANAEVPAVEKSNATSLAPVVLNVIVAYTPTARVEAGGTAAIEALALLAVSETNTSYENAGAHVRLALAHVYETTQDDQAPFSATLNAFRDPTDGIFDEIHAKRTAFGGDLSVILSREGSSCGVGYIHANSSLAFALSAWDCATGNYSFGHEIGHNFGLRHNTEEDSELSPYPYGHGLLSAANGWRTVMSYNNATCPGGFCSRLPRFSTPHVSLAGVPTGDEELRNSARVLDRRANVIASFMGGNVSSTLSTGSGPLLFQLNGGQSTTQSFALSNAGAGILTFDASTRQNGGRAGSDAYSVATSDDAGGPVVGLENISATGTPLSFAITNSCTASNGANDNGWATVAVPFPFSFYGDTVSSLRVSPNGVIATDPSFDGCAALPEPMPSGSSPNGLIAPYWTDQLLGFPTSASGVSTESRGSVGAGDARLIIQWTGSYRYGRVSNELNTYQVVLHQDGSVVFQYGDMEGSDNDFSGVGIGLERGDGNGGVQLDMKSGLFASDNFAVLFRPVAEWLSIDGATYGALEGGESGMVTLRAAANLAAGVYEGSFSIATNDPATPFVTVPVELTVLASAIADGGPGWRLIAPPAAGITVDHLAALNLVQGVPGFYPAAQPNLFTEHDGTTYTASTGVGEALALGHGAWWYLFDADITPGGPSNSVALPALLSTAQAANQADTTVPVHGNGWNMLGNPFGTCIDVTDVASWPGATTALSSIVLQAWNPTTSSYVSSATASTFSSWQGFFAENNGVPSTFTIPATAAVDGGTFLRNTSPAHLVAFELAAADGPQRDFASVLAFSEDATDGRDLFDATKVEPNADSYVTLGFSAGAGELRAVESRPLDAVTFSVPLVVRSVAAGSDLVLTWPRVEGIPASWTLELRDLETGAVIDLRRDSLYSFSVVPDAARTVSAGPTAGSLAQHAPARFKLDVRTERSVATAPEESAQLVLRAPRPNPVRNSAQISFSTPMSGAVRLEAFDVQGRQVALLADGEMEAGARDAFWSVEGLASGVYVLRLQAGADVLTQRVIVTR